MLTSVYDAHNNNDKRVINIAQLSLSAVLNMRKKEYKFMLKEQIFVHKTK